MIISLNEWVEGEAANRPDTLDFVVREMFIIIRKKAEFCKWMFVATMKISLGMLHTRGQFVIGTLNGNRV